MQQRGSIESINVTKIIEKAKLRRDDRKNDHQPFIPTEQTTT